ncbi:ArnT family glycosyltransferase [Parashewanella tropica]|uniref:ArnT family glycosyltransferase n=1 Tax=Parashewanella tropica TaxID=2547970 RepID=UPI00105A8CCA|nr:glycosyltransferase family 39 protein [Parashewanella tropica]
MQIKAEQKWLFIVFVALAVVLVAGLGLRFPWPADEPRFAQVAREMLQSGQWLFPSRAGEYYPDKPPVFMWLIAVFYQLTGNLKVAFLLPSAFAGFLTAYMVYDLSKRLYDHKVAFTALLILIATPQFLIQAKTAQIDMTLCFFTTVGCYGMVRYFILGNGLRWLYLGASAMGLGIITKGVGFLPLLMFIPLLVWFRNYQTPHRPWNALVWLTPVIMLAVVALWLLPMLHIVDNSGSADLVSYKNNILFKQTAERYANAWHHIKPWYYYISQVMPFLWLPLFIMLLAGGRTTLDVIKQDKVVKTLFVWAILVVVFFSISAGKRAVYILPALPMLSIVGAVCWLRLTKMELGRWISQALWTIYVLLMVIAIILLSAFYFGLLDIPQKNLVYKPLFEQAYWPVVIASIVGVGFCIWQRKKDIFIQLSTLTIGAWLVTALLIWPAIDPYRTPEKIMKKVAQTLPQDSELGLVKFKEQLLMFVDRPVTQFSYLAPDKVQFERAWQWQAQQENRYILTSSEASLSCYTLKGAIHLGEAHRRQWYLLSDKQRLSTCPKPSVMKTYHYTPSSQIGFQ